MGTFLFLLGTLYIVSLMVKNKRENTNKVSQVNQGNAPSQGINDTGGTKAETEESITKFLSSKTELIASSVNSSTDNFLADPVFQGIYKSLLNKVSAEMSLFDTPISVNFRKVIINSDGRSGRVYVTFTGKSGKTGNYEFIYSKNVENEWKLVDFAISKPIELKIEPTVNP